MFGQNQPQVQEALARRNESLARFWFADPNTRAQLDTVSTGRTAVVIDAEDSFTEMLAQQLSAIGLLVTIRKIEGFDLIKGYWDLVVMGPGPGDPSNMDDLRIASLQKMLVDLFAKQQPLLAVCLSHQILCLNLGLKLVRRIPPNQGVQREIDFFGTRECVGFYNTYVAKCDQDYAQSLNNRGIEISRDLETNEVYALRGPKFVSLQFHPESLLTRNGIDIIASSVRRVIQI